MRPGATDAEKEGWLKPSAVIDAVVNGLEQLPFKGIREIDLFVPMEEKPDYNSPKWFRRWQEQMGGLSLGA
jgi:hypothetical protein